MTAIFSYDFLNQVNIRCKNLKADAIWLKNDISGEYERLTNGGSGPTPTLPYYLKSNNIKIDSGTNSSNLSPTGLDIIDSTSTETLTKDKIKILSQLKDNIVDFIPGFYQAIFPVAYNNTTSNFERLSRLTVGTYSQYSDVSQAGMSSVNGTNMVQISPTGLNIKSPIGEHFLTASAFKGLKQIVDNVAAPSMGSTFSGKFLVSYNKTTDTFERPNNFSLGSSTIYSYFDDLSVKVTNGNFYTIVTSQGLTVKYNSTTAFFNYEDVKTCNKLYSPPLITPVGTSKMVIFDTASRVYNTANIPTSYTPIVKYKVIEAGFFTRVNLTNYYSKTYEFPVGDSQPLYTYTLPMNTGDKLILVSQNTDSTKLIKTNNWYVIKLTDNSPNAIDAKFTFDVFPEAGPISGRTMSGDYKIRFRRISPTANDGVEPYPAVVPSNSIMFSVTEETNDKYAMIDSTAILSYRDYDVAKPFAGTIIINCITSDYKTGSLGFKKIETNEDFISNDIDLQTQVYPNYIKDNSSSNSYLNSLGPDGQVLVKNGKITVSDSVDTEFAPEISIQNNGITFDDGFNSPTVLNKQLIDSIPKKYNFKIPGIYNWKLILDETIINDEVDFKSEPLTKFPIKNIGDTVYVDMSLYTINFNDFSDANHHPGLVFTADVFEDMQNPTFDIKYSGAGNFTTKLIKVKNGSSPNKMNACFIEISGTTGTFTGILSIKVKEGQSFNHKNINTISGWPSESVV